MRQPSLDLADRIERIATDMGTLAHGIKNLTDKAVLSGKVLLEVTTATSKTVIASPVDMKSVLCVMREEYARKWIELRKLLTESSEGSSNV